MLTTIVRSARSRPRPWSQAVREIHSLVDALMAFLRASDEACGAESLCEELPWLCAWFERETDKQRLAIDEVRRLAGLAIGVIDARFLRALLEQARGDVRRVLHLQEVKEERLRQLRSSDLGESGA